MTAFKPKDGLQSRWKYCYELVTSVQSGDGIQGQEVMEACHCDWDEALEAMRIAREKLNRDGELSVRTVTKYGWIKLHPGEQLKQGEQHSNRAKKAMTKAVRSLNPADSHREELTQSERDNLDRSKARYSVLAQLHRGRKLDLDDLERKSKKIE